MGLDQYLVEPGNEEMPIVQWRKANAVHRWFLNRLGLDENFNIGHDTPEFGMDVLEELKSDCEAALNNDPVALQKLEPMGGFFFGSRDRDAMWEDDLKFTINKIDDLRHKNINVFKYECWW